MKRHLFTFLYFCLALFGANALTFDEAVASVVGSNPALKEAEASRQATLAQLKSENNLSDPEVSFDHLWGPSSDENRWGLEVTQEFDWPGAYRARSRAIGAQKDAFSQLARKERLDMEQKVKLLMISIVTAKRRVDLYAHIDTAYHELDARYRRAYDMGECTILDVNKIRIESATNCVALSDARLRLSQLVGELTALAGGIDCSAIVASLDSYPDYKILPEEQYEKALRLNDPALLEAQSNKVAATERAKAGKLSAFPKFTLGYVHEFEEDMNFNGFSVGVSLPIFSSRHRKEAANAEILSSAFAFDAAEIEAITQMRLDREEAIRLVEDCRKYEDALTPDNFRLLKMAVDGGEINVLTYIQEVSYFLQASDRYLTLNDQRYQALCRLNRLIATD